MCQNHCSMFKTIIIDGAIILEPTKKMNKHMPINKYSYKYDILNRL